MFLSVGLIRSPVDFYEKALVEARSYVRKEAPFTFIAYRNLIPAEDDDCFFLMKKVAGFVAFNSFIQLTANHLTNSFVCLSFVPFILDVGWKCYKIVQIFSFDQNVDENTKRRMLIVQLVHLASLIVFIGIGGCFFVEPILA
jgi:hypothetical protein